MEKTKKELNINKDLEFFPNWFFDKEIHLIYTRDISFYLTRKELIFFKMLLENKTITYKDMNNIWVKKENVTPNAIRSFVKNFKKKMPANILKNISGTGYTLINFY